MEAGAMTIDVDGEGGAPARGQLTGLQLRGALEAILLIVDEPADPTVLAQVLETPEPEIIALLRALQGDYDEAERGFELREIAGGWRLYTRAEFASFVERFVLEGQQARLTQAALETLAVVAYRQPVSRTRVSAVRGVNVDGVMRTLASRGLVEEAGADHESGAILYQTSRYFLERLGLSGLTELPNLADFLPESTTIDQLEDELSSEG
jgi:segregation and condensation protein B